MVFIAGSKPPRKSPSFFHRLFAFWGAFIGIGSGGANLPALAYRQTQDELTESKDPPQWSFALLLPIEGIRSAGLDPTGRYLLTIGPDGRHVFNLEDGQCQAHDAADGLRTRLPIPKVKPPLGLGDLIAALGEDVRLPAKIRLTGEAAAKVTAAAEAAEAEGIGPLAGQTIALWGWPGRKPSRKLLREGRLVSNGLSDIRVVLATPRMDNTPPQIIGDSVIAAGSRLDSPLTAEEGCRLIVVQDDGIYVFNRLS